MSSLGSETEQTWLPWWPNQLFQVLQTNICCWHTHSMATAHQNINKFQCFSTLLWRVGLMIMINICWSSIYFAEVTGAGALIVFEAVMELWQKCMLWIITDKWSTSNQRTVFMMLFFFGIACLRMSEPLEGHLLTRDMESGSISIQPDFSHFSDPSCGFAADSGDPSLFWITRCY